MSLFDTFMSDTVGVVYRAGTGNVDPWTKQELIDQETAGNVAAGGDPVSSATQAEADVTSTLKTFTLGGDDRVGADPSQTTGINLPSHQALKDTFQSLTNDDGSGCGITNLAGCFPEVPSWLPYAVIGVGIAGVLWLLRPYIGLANSVRG